MSRQAEWNARDRAERRATGRCIEIGCPLKAERGRARCAEHLEADRSRRAARRAKERT